MQVENEALPFDKLLAPGQAGDEEFRQIMLVLLTLNEAPKADGIVNHLDVDVWQCGRTVYVCLPPSRSDRPAQDEIERSTPGQILDKALKVPKRRRPNRLVLATPMARSKDALAYHAKRWLKVLGADCRMTFWGPEQIKELLISVPLLCLRYNPTHFPDGQTRRQALNDLRARYDAEFRKLYGKINFVGMSVYKEEASTGVDMARIYIPLRVVPEAAEEGAVQTDPLQLLTPGARQVILGDPGSGKSTLLRFLALAGKHPALRMRAGAREDDRLPILITLRRYADELRLRPDLALMDYSVEHCRAELGLKEVSRDLLGYYLYAGKALVFLDGADELPGSEFKALVRSRVNDFLKDFPGNTVVVTSRIVGYEKEVRYDGIGFSHHRVAGLTLKDIKQFVGDWYCARLESSVEQKRHVDELTRILTEDDSHAIRELAANPLLLTIICLVHRVDAVLPDKRVVLYQKCTETLLNTWHTWKFRHDQERDRGNVEARHRGRMEAIAYWMHCLLEAQGDKRQAVVSYQDLRDFLERYIAEIEEPEHESAGDVAETFLKFVKERAGLLVEVGDGRYSFVHLTFQEFLAAIYLKNSGEQGGMDAVWRTIAPRCGDSRWHEVIRLLVGSLQRTASQKSLLEKILSGAEGPDAPGRALVAGGCLIDNIDGTRKLRDRILTCLLLVAAKAASVEELRKPLRMLSLWRERESGNWAVLLNLIRHATGQSDGEELRTALALNMLSMGWSDEDVRSLGSQLHDITSRHGQIYQSVIHRGLPRAELSLIAEDVALLQLSAATMGLLEPASTFVGAVHSCLCSTGSIKDRAEPSPPFVTLLCWIAYPTGPFGYGLHYWYRVRQLGVFSQFLASLAEARYQKPGLELVLETAMKTVLETDRFRKYPSHNRDRALAMITARYPGRAPELARTLIHSHEWWFDNRDPNRDLDRDLNRMMLQNLEGDLRSHAWSSICNNPSLRVPLLDNATALLRLTPKVQWIEAIRVCGLPQIPHRITLFDPQVWQRTLSAFDSGLADEVDVLHASAQLLLDCWLWGRNASHTPFERLASLTRHAEAAPLRVAHCIRDIAYGDQSKIESLREMVQSEDPAYRSLFEAALWVDSFGPKPLTRTRPGRGK